MFGVLVNSSEILLGEFSTTYLLSKSVGKLCNIWENFEMWIWWRKTEYLQDWNSGRPSLETFEHYNFKYDSIMLFWKKSYLVKSVQ